MTATSRIVRLSALAFAFAFVAPSAATAAPTGVELTLSGGNVGRPGGALRYVGTAYAVEGLLDLRPLPRAQITAELQQRVPGPEQWRSVSRAEARADREGRFTLALPVPARGDLGAVRASLRVGPEGGETRRFLFPVRLEPAERIEVLLDRRRYEPGETLHALLRRLRRADGVPVAGVLRVNLRGPGGPVHESTDRTDASGAVMLAVPLPEGLAEGTYTLSVRGTDGLPALQVDQPFQVGRRTVERLAVSVRVEPAVVRPGASVRALVRVSTPSGTPVRGARVELTHAGNTRQATTDAEGRVVATFDAPTFVAGDVQPVLVTVNARHQSYGALRAAGRYTVARVDHQVEAQPEGGALVPEVPSEVYLAVTDPRGEPAPAGTSLVVRGPGVLARQGALTTDAQGFARLPVPLPGGIAAAIRDCPGAASVRLEVEVKVPERVSTFARVCVPVAPRARVRPRARAAIVAPGGAVDVALARHPEARSLPVLVSLLADGRPLAHAVTRGPNAELTLPPGVTGLVRVRARPVLPANAEAPFDQPGAVALGVGADAAVLVRPAEAFGLTLRTDRPRYRIQEEAELTLRASREPGPAWFALVSRDLAAHGGELDYRLGWLGGAVQEALASPDASDDALLRAALAASLGPLRPSARTPPLTPPLWGGESPAGVAMLRDATQQRETFRRRGIATPMMALENVLRSLAPTDPLRAEMIRGARFHPDVVARLVARELLPAGMTRTLGEGRLTLAMLQSEDPSFTLPRVAGRIARARLVKLLVALAALTNPDDANAARALQGQPPERWLSRLVQLGALRPADLVDPWGTPFALRRASAPRVLISEQAAGYELASAGGDRRFGTADDVRDPFARLVPEGTPYAVGSGEDALMRRLSTLAPGPGTLARMQRAYGTVGLAASEERERSVLGARETEADESMGLGGLGIAGTGTGGGGYGRGAGTIERGRVAASAPSVSEPAPDEVAGDFDDVAEEGRREPPRDAPAPPPPAPPTFAALSTVIREDFPATLFVAPVTSFDGRAASLRMPLADALTTYRVEAVAWNASGWVSRGRVELEVDQAATVDAPVPPFATVGDRIRLPVRVQNRTDAPLPVQVRVEAEGLTIESGDAAPLTVPPLDAATVVVDVRVTEAGVGALVVRASRPRDEGPLDAVRRPLRADAEARLVRVAQQALLEPGRPLRLEVPRGAEARGPATLRVLSGARLFGPSRAAASTPVAAAFLKRLAGEEAEPAERAAVLRVLGASDANAARRVGRNASELALAVGASWGDGTVSDEVLGRALVALAAPLGAGEAPPDLARAPSTVQQASMLLLPLALTGTGRPALRADRESLVNALERRLDGAAAALSPGSPLTALAALALAAPGALGNGDEARESRARELLRRAEREAVVVETAGGAQAFLEPPDQVGEPRARLVPTGWAAAAWAALGEGPRSLRYLRHLLRFAGAQSLWPGPARFGAALAAT
ncbi:MAG: alpha-2-macroglobulin family protein, partial [Myxococcota bacterium]